MMRVRLKGEAASILGARNEIEEQLVANAYLAQAPFKTVSIIFRYTNQNEWRPDSYEIDEKTQALKLAIDFDAEKLKALPPPALRETFRTAIIEVLCNVSANFDLPYEFLDAMRRKPPSAAQLGIQADAALPRRLT